MKFDFVGRKYIWFTISGLVILTGIVGFILRGGPKFGVDFTGGTILNMQLNKAVTAEEVRSILAAKKLEGSIVQLIGAEGKSTSIQMQSRFLSAQEVGDLKTAFRDKYGIKKDPKTGKEEVTEESFGPKFAKEVANSALLAFGLAILLILAYVAYRFEFKMAITAIAEITHDLLIIVGIYTISGREVSTAVVVALLTILGYSLYDTVIIFDRIRDNTKTMSKITYSEMVNVSIRQTLVRSINTSLTTLIPLVCILIFGGKTLKDFAFALFVGIITGTYSSIFVGSPILAMWKEREPRYRTLRERYEGTEPVKKVAVKKGPEKKVPEKKEKKLPKKEVMAEPEIESILNEEEVSEEKVEVKPKTTMTPKQAQFQRKKKAKVRYGSKGKKKKKKKKR